MTETTDQGGFAYEGLVRLWPVTGWRRWTRFAFIVIWLVYLAQPLGTLGNTGHSAGWLAAAIAVTTAFCAVYLAVVANWDRYPGWAGYGVGLLFPLAAAFSLLFSGHGAGGSVVWIYVSLATGAVVSSRRATRLAIEGVVACYLLFSWIGHDGMSSTLITLIPVLLAGIMMSGMRTRIKLLAELHQAREEVAKHAANEERLRLARDMHDLTGQSLSMITLKSELAARLLGRLPASPPRDRAADEIEQVAAVSRQTLRDIREAISGYRRPTLAVEIITARAALASAGIAVHDDADLTLLSGTFDPDAEAALAWCLREAVTNVVRHSAARECRIRLTGHGQTVSLEVRDDGNGFPAQSAQSAQSAEPADSVPGSGLRGMSERLLAVGGSLELRPDARPGFRLIATVPALAGTLAPVGVTVTG